MGLPTKPTLDYSYVAFQQSQGDNAFPGTEIDNDHANLKLSIDETIDFIGGSFRSDGVLKASAYPGASDLNEYVATATAAADEASASADAAAASAVSAAASLDTFTDLYLGAKSSDPTLDNDGNALQDGATYWNTSAKVLRIYDLGTVTWASGVQTSGITTDTFVGDGVEVDFELSVAPTTIGNTQVYVGGVYQEKAEYSVAGSTLTFNTAPPNGVGVQVMTFEQILINVPADGSVTAAKLATGAIEAKLGYTPANRSAFPVNVISHGADPTGVADSFAAFQAAKTAAGSRGTIVVPAGTYNLSASVNSGQYIWFKEGAVTFTGAGASAGLPFVVREFGSSDGVADSLYSGPDSKWINTQFTALTGRAGAATVSSVVGASHFGHGGVLGASRTSDSAVAAAESAIGVFGVVLNDNATQVQTGYAFYGDAVRSSGAGTTFGFELDTINLGSEVQITPNAMFPSGATVNFWAAAGGAVAGANKSSAAFGVTTNAKKFLAGLVVKQDALDGTDGLDGDTGRAHLIRSGKGQGWQQYNNAGNLGSGIFLAAHSPGVATTLELGESGFYLTGTSDGRSLLQVEATASAANRAVIRPAATGGALEYTVAGDTNASFKLTPAGTGQVFAGSAAVPGSRPTNPGRLVLTDYGGLASNSGLEWANTTFGSGYGWKVTTEDEGGGSTPLTFGYRSNSATWTGHMQLRANGSLRLPRLSSDPSGGVLGELYYNTTTNLVKFHNGTAWGNI